MKLLILADIHGDLNRLLEIEAVLAVCDAIIVAGDITDFGGIEQARIVLETLSDAGRPILAVPGNCDLPGVEEELSRYHSNLHGNGIPCGGFNFVGVGGALPGGSARPAKEAEDDFRGVLEKSLSTLASKENLVLVTHQPAWNTQLDNTGSERHGGSLAIREFIEQYKPVLAISGHFHDAYGVDEVGPTTLINPGAFRRGRYAVADITENQVKVALFP